MKIFFLLPVILLLIFSLSVPEVNLHADEVDLVKLKKQEEERRKKLKEQNKKTVVVTNEILKKYGESKKKNDTKNKPAVQKRAEEPEKPEKVDPIKTKEYWQKLKNDLENRIKELKDRLEKNQLELNRLTTQYFIMDLPIEKQRIKDHKESMQKIVEGQKATLKQLQAEFDALPEKARKAGVPYGWIR
jgi:hypothetical protein